MFIRLVLTHLLVTCVACNTRDNYVQVNTNLGKLRGLQQDVMDKTINIFQSVPFAEPPVGSRRFKRPEPVESWDDVKDALEAPLSCSQHVDTFLSKYDNEVYQIAPKTDDGEDCLYLNIWAPAQAVNAAVMIWIHGGGFTTGSSTQGVYDGKYLAALGDVIVVSIQYRLGIFGFLYLGTDDAPGNMGLLDQYLAIRWVKDNIANFGGDPERITLFGESSGAASIKLHMLSPLPKLFHNAILQSCPSLDITFSEPEHAFNLYQQLADALGCMEYDPELILSCLQKLDAEFITSTLQTLGGVGVGATQDGVFFAKDEHIQSRFEYVTDVNIMIGTNENEGHALLFFVAPELMRSGQISKPEITHERFREIVKTLTPAGDDATLEKLLQTYGGNRPKSNLDLLEMIVNDVWFTCPSIELASKFKDQNQVYAYRVNHRTEYCFWPRWAGAVHGCEIDSVFGVPQGSGLAGYTQEDKEFSSRVVTYWTNFAKTGDPNSGASSPPGDPWLPHDGDSYTYHQLTMPEFATAYNLSHGPCLFWDALRRKVSAKIQDEL